MLRDELGISQPMLLTPVNHLLQGQTIEPVGARSRIVATPTIGTTVVHGRDGVVIWIISPDESSIAILVGKLDRGVELIVTDDTTVLLSPDRRVGLGEQIGLADELVDGLHKKSSFLAVMTADKIYRAMPLVVGLCSKHKTLQKASCYSVVNQTKSPQKSKKHGLRQ
jgi:hypothetical protein